jgi:ankyrin repeat protein
MRISFFLLLKRSLMTAVNTQPLSPLSESTPEPLGQFSLLHNHFVQWIRETIPSYQIMYIETQDPLWKKICKVVAGPFMLLLCAMSSLSHFCFHIEEELQHLSPDQSEQAALPLSPAPSPTPEANYHYQVFTALSEVDEQRGLDIIRALNHDARNLFHHRLVNDAIMGRKSPEFIRELLRLGFSPLSTRHNYELTALQTATELNLSDIVRILLEYGAAADAHCLSIACSRENVEIVQILLEAHAPLHDDHYFPLHIATGRGNREIMDLLVQAGADVRGVNSKNETLLHRICGEGQIGIDSSYGYDLCHLRVPPRVQRQIVLWLIEQNVPILAQNQRGHTALGSAVRAWKVAPSSERHQYETIADLLFERGADRAEWERLVWETISRDDLMF